MQPFGVYSCDSSSPIITFLRYPYVAWEWYFFSYFYVRIVCGKEMFKFSFSKLVGANCYIVSDQ